MNTNYEKIFNYFIAIKLILILILISFLIEDKIINPYFYTYKNTEVTKDSNNLRFTIYNKNNSINEKENINVNMFKQESNLKNVYKFIGFFNQGNKKIIILRNIKTNEEEIFSNTEKILNKYSILSVDTQQILLKNNENGKEEFLIKEIENDTKNISFVSSNVEKKVLNKDFILNLKSNPSLLFSEIKLSFENNSKYGNIAKVDKIEKGSIFENKIEVEDLIISINNTEVSNYNGLLSLFDDVEKLKVLKIKINRNDLEKEIEYEINK